MFYLACDGQNLFKEIPKLLKTALLTGSRLYLVMNCPQVLVQETFGSRPILALVAPVRPLLKLDQNH
jgi:hypothetical protein